MPKLAQWALDLWAAVLENDDAKEALARIERDATILIGAAQEALTTGRMLSLVAALGNDVRSRKHG